MENVKYSATALNGRIMTAAEFKAWRARMGWSQAKAAEELGVARAAIQN